MRLSYISIPSVIIPPSAVVGALLAASPKKSHQKHTANRLLHRATTPSFWLSLLAVCVFLSLVKLVLVSRPMMDNISTCGRPALSLTRSSDTVLMSSLQAIHEPHLAMGAAASTEEHYIEPVNDRPNADFIQPFSPHSFDSETANEEAEFWKQPDNQAFKPCLNFTSRYVQDTNRIASQRKQKYLLVIVSGGLNQQRNQIVDAVVIARILEAVLVVPILQVNQVWNDHSEFSDIFDVEHFKRVLKDDVMVVSSLPSTHLMSRPVQERSTPLNASPQWFRSHYMKRFSREGVLLLRGIDGRLSKDLPLDLQKLRCKVAFHALRFTAPIMEIGTRFARRMWEGGPYVALHLRLEKDVWVRTGCLPGLGPEFDEIVRHERIDNPSLLTARSNMTYEERKLAGLCPLNAAEVARLLKGLGAPKNTRIFWAGGEPLAGELALRSLIDEFGPLHNKKSLALPGELDAFANKASVLAAIDYLICLHSDVFMPSHGGNMARALQGHRAYGGYRKHIMPNKREMFPYFLNASLSTDEHKLDLIIRNLHRDSFGQPALRTDKKGRDVLAYPAPECMCASSSSAASIM